MVPEPGGHAGAEARKQDHGPDYRRLQARSLPGSAGYVDPTARPARIPGWGLACSLEQSPRQLAWAGRTSICVLKGFLGGEQQKWPLPPLAKQMDVWEVRRSTGPAGKREKRSSREGKAGLQPVLWWGTHPAGVRQRRAEAWSCGHACLPHPRVQEAEKAGGDMRISNPIQEFAEEQHRVHTHLNT